MTLACIAAWFALAVPGTLSAADHALPQSRAEAALVAPAGYRLVWADEFNDDGPPDPANWTFEHGFVRNRELQWYRPENARCAGGRLIIEARREVVPNPRHDPGSRAWQRNRAQADYTSASLTTRGRHAWLYGRFEVRARIEARAGLWPAIWTVGVRGTWPANGEVDLMEYYRGMILANLFWAEAGRKEPASDVVREPLAALGGADWAEQFHVWRMEWEPDEIRLYVDDRLLNRTTLSAAQQLREDLPHPFRQPHFLILNLAVGGAGGDPQDTRFPARFEVDYVRVFQRVE